MQDGIKIGVVGGDCRMLLAARCLSERYECAVWGLDGEGGDLPAGAVRCADPVSAVRGASAVLLPLPVSRDGIRLYAPLADHAPELIPLIREAEPGGILLGGKIPPGTVEAARERGIRACDYFEDEAVQIGNAVPTAEGALAACIEALPVTVSGMRAAILGYGRVGRTLAQRMIALGAKVTAAARSPKDLAWAEADGCEPVPLAEFLASPPWCAALFNTIPARTLGRETLSKLPRETVIFELASDGGGVDAEAAADCGIRLVPLPSLPGKTAPETAGEIVCRAVCRRIREFFGTPECEEGRGRE